ncbi:MAG: 4-hydroxy-tetrahydrodipicolinate synthase [Armatimonadota bacterium]
MARFGTTLTAMVTPFDEHLDVDYDRAAELAKRLIDDGCDGLIVTGTTGESPTLTHDEKLKLYEVTKEAVGDAFIVAGPGTNNTADTVALTQKASELPIDGMMFVGPYYNKPSQEGFYQHFKACAAATDLPCIVYNVPGRTGKNIEASTVVRLAEDVDNIVACKEASGDIGQIAQICRTTPDDFEVYSGDDGMTLPILSVGGVGVISVAAHLDAFRISEMIRAYNTGNVAEATTLHRILSPVFDACFLPSGNPACVKRGLELMGFPVGGTRLPIVPASDEDTETIRAALDDADLL